MKKRILAIGAVALLTGCGTSKFNLVSTKSNYTLQGTYDDGLQVTGQHEITIRGHKGLCNVTLNNVSGNNRLLIGSFGGRCLVSTPSNNYICEITPKTMYNPTMSGTCKTEKDEFMIFEVKKEY